MRMRGMGTKTVSRKKTAQKPAGKKTKICPETGLKLINKGWYDQVVKPKLPRHCPEITDTVEELVKRAHYILVETWDDPDAPTVCELTKETVGAALQMGWRGHMTQWSNNILAGEVRHGEVDNTPRKLQRKLQ